MRRRRHSSRRRCGGGCRAGRWLGMPCSWTLVKASPTTVLGAAPDSREVVLGERVEGPVVVERPIAPEHPDPPADDAAKLDAQQAPGGPATRRPQGGPPAGSGTRSGSRRTLEAITVPSPGYGVAWTSLPGRLRSAARRWPRARYLTPSRAMNDDQRGAGGAVGEHARVPGEVEPALPQRLPQRSLDVVEVVVHLSSSWDLNRPQAAAHVLPDDRLGALQLGGEAPRRSAPRRPVPAAPHGWRTAAARAARAACSSRLASSSTRSRSASVRAHGVTPRRRRAVASMRPLRRLSGELVAGDAQQPGRPPSRAAAGTVGPPSARPRRPPPTGPPPAPGCRSHADTNARPAACNAGTGPRRRLRPRSPSQPPARCRDRRSIRASDPSLRAARICDAGPTPARVPLTRRRTRSR